MATANADVVNGIFLEKDLYKNNTLVLKKGVMLNAYILTKLFNFGFTAEEIFGKNLSALYNDIPAVSQPDISASNSEHNKVGNILILNKNIFEAQRIRVILNNAGYSENIQLQDKFSESNLKTKDISFVFVDAKSYTNRLLDSLTLLECNKKITVFVLNTESYNVKQFSFNTDLINVRFLYSLLTPDNVKALFKLYS